MKHWVGKKSAGAWWRRALLHKTSFFAAHFFYLCHYLTFFSSQKATLISFYLTCISVILPLIRSMTHWRAMSLSVVPSFRIFLFYSLSTILFLIYYIIAANTLYKFYLLALPIHGSLVFMAPLKKPLKVNVIQTQLFLHSAPKLWKWKLLVQGKRNYVWHLRQLNRYLYKRISSASNYLHNDLVHSFYVSG